MRAARLLVLLLPLFPAIAYAADFDFVTPYVDNGTNKVEQSHFEEMRDGFRALADCASTSALTGNASGANNWPPACKTASQIIDTIGTTRGSILYRGASVWTALTPGTVDLPLVSNGSGADPAYEVLPVAGGGTGSTSASAARTALGVAIGTDVQAFDADLSTWAGVTPHANSQTALPIATGSAGAFGVVFARGNGQSLDSASLNTETCSNVDVSVTGAASTDVVLWNPDGPIDGVTGFGADDTGAVSIQAYAITNNVRFRFCNPTTGTINPGAITVNWRIIR